MDENRNVAGKVEEGLGRAAGDASSEFKANSERSQAQPKICTVRQLTPPPADRRHL
jgi:hypothetical protein